MVSTKQIPEEAEVYSPEVQGSELAVRPPRYPRDPELHHFMVTPAKVALEIPTILLYHQVNNTRIPKMSACFCCMHIQIRQIRT